MKTCKAESCTYPVFGKGYCKLHQWMREDKKQKEVKQRKPIRPMSKKLAKERKTYRELREEFLSRPENLFCAVYPSIPASQVHHMAGRIGSMLNDTSLWLAVSDVGHRWLEENPKLAKERGFSVSRLKLVKPLNEE